jgi:ABC-2 type transport system permease protein
MFAMTQVLFGAGWRGSWDFIWSLPAPRSAAVVSTFTAFTAMAIPGIVIALAAGERRHRQRAIFVVLLYSPMIFPITQLPSWLAVLHRALPIYCAAQVLRASVISGLVTGVTVAYAVLAAWTAAAWAATAWVVARRR